MGRKSQTPTQFKTAPKPKTPSAASKPLDINEPSLNIPHDGKVKEVKHSESNSNSKRSVDVEDSAAADASEGLHGFTQAYARKKRVDKIKRSMENQSRRSDEGSKRRYAGFGETLAPEKKVSKKRRKENESNTGRVKKKTQVSQTERDLMEELLLIGDTAVAESIPLVADVPPPNSNVAPGKTGHVNNSMLELEQLETLQEPGDIV